MCNSITAEQILKIPYNYPLRAVVLQVLGEIRKMQQKETDDALNLEIRGLNNDDMKKAVRVRQQPLAEREAQLRDLLETLEAAADVKGQEPSKRWRAHYEYLVAAVQLRIAAIGELNHALGQARRDILPAPPDGATMFGWRLASSEKMMSPRPVVDLADKARKALAQIVKDHPETPWAALAKRERLAMLGLQWQSFRIVE